MPDLSGKTARLGDYRGKVVLLDFWATYCDACRDAIPVFQKMSESYGSKGFEVVGVSIDSYTGNVADFAKENGMRYRVALDSGLAAARAYGVRGLPASFLVGRDGKIRRAWMGYDAAVAADIESQVRTALQ